MIDMDFKQDGLQDYLKNVGSHRLLSREEEVELFQQMESGDDSAREEIVRCNLRLVVKIAMQFKGKGFPLADLIQEGNVGLLHVVSKFDWRKGFRFSTYAAFWIRQEMQAALRLNNSLIRLPIRKARMVGRISEAIRWFQRSEGREPQVPELAAFLDIEESLVESLLPMREAMLSLDAKGDDDSVSLMQSIPSKTAPAYEDLNDRQVSAVVRNVLDILTERERSIMELRFGLNDGRSLSLRKTSRKVGLSQEGVRRIERRALDKLSRPSIRARLDGLLAG